MNLFARFGIPDTIMSDNGTHFMEKDFKDFCKAFAIVHVLTAPYYIRSNDWVERFVRTFKRAFKKSDGNETVGDILQF